MEDDERKGQENGQRVLILGGGFAGVFTALELERVLRPGDRTEVTLISRDNFFLFTPMLPEVGGSSIEPAHAVNPIRNLFKRTRFFEGEVTQLDTPGSRVMVQRPSGQDHEFFYDHLVVALGATNAFFGMQDVEEHAIAAKTLGDAIHLRNRLIELLETAATETNEEARREMLTFVLVGGGFTGVETVGAINALVRDALPVYPTISQRDVRVVLVEAAARLLPEFDPSLAQYAQQKLQEAGVEVRLNAKVTGANSQAVFMERGQQISTQTLVWASGITPHSICASSGLPTQGRGWIEVDACFRVDGHPGVWALGDCARIPNVQQPGKFQPALAQHAMREAKRAARNIVATIRARPVKQFRYQSLGQMATLGYYNGIATLGPFRLAGISLGPLKVSGFPAWWLWRTYYLWRLPRMAKRLRVLVDWTAEIVFGRDISQMETYRLNEPVD